MSDYVRKKCVRFKIPQNIIDKLKNEDEWLEDLLLKEYNVKENYHTKNDFTINSGLNYENDEYEYFLDYQLDYEYGASGDFKNVRLLTDTEFKKVILTSYGWKEIGEKLGYSNIPSSNVKDKIIRILKKLQNMTLE